MSQECQERTASIRDVADSPVQTKQIWALDSHCSNLILVRQTDFADKLQGGRMFFVAECCGCVYKLTVRKPPPPRMDSWLERWMVSLYSLRIMTREKIFYYSRILLIAAEVFLISFLSYAVVKYSPIEMGRYISLDVLYCLPIIQTARLAAIHATRSSDTQTSTFVGIAVALVWSATDAAISWPYFPMNAFLLNTFTRSVVFTVIGRVLVKLRRESEYARKDMLTGLANRVEFLERLGVEQGRSERSGRPYSLLFIDIDYFKALNDAHGHRVGDEALRVLADILRESSRQVDIAARLGGDEFVLLLPDTDEQSCSILIKRIESSAKQVFEGRSWPISVSIGRATETGRTQKVEWVIQLADENMYEAKRMKQQMMNGTNSQ